MLHQKRALLSLFTGPSGRLAQVPMRHFLFQMKILSIYLSIYLERTKVRHTLASPIYEAWNRIVGMGPSTKNNFRLDGYNLCTHTRPDGRPGS